MSHKTQIGLDASITKNPTQDDFDKVRAFLGSDFVGVEKHRQQEILKGTYSTLQDASRSTSIMNRAPFSLGNRFALFTWMGMHGIPSEDLTKYYFDQADNPIVAPRESRVPTVSNIVNYFADRYGGIEYAYSDFLFCKYFNEIPNNHLITLRRFASPCEDNIYQVKKSLATDSGKADEIDLTAPDIARAVTWMSEAAGNKMEDLLKFTYGYKWKTQTSETNVQESTDGGYTTQPFYSKFGPAGAGFFDTLKGISPGEKARRSRLGGHDPLTETYPNFVQGPVDVINEMETRDIGLQYEQQLKVVFEYELKSYSGLNPKVAMLDIFANLMVLTYNNANFWGGANRFYGGAGYVASRFGDPHKLAQGDFKGYLQTIVNDVGGGFKSVFGTGDGGFTVESVLDGLKKVGGNVLGNMLGGLINKQLGAAPAYQAIKALMTGEPTGNWHLTIGNPMNPIAMIGNLTVQNTELTFTGGLGRDDFPNALRLEVTLKHARPRDKSDFESMFNAGKGRIYGGAKDLKDVLNLEGKSIKTYGSFSDDATNAVSARDVEATARSRAGFGKFADKSDNLIESLDAMVNR